MLFGALKSAKTITLKLKSLMYLFIIFTYIVENFHKCFY